MLLQAGLVRTKNTVDTLIKFLTIFGVASIVYLFIGYDFMHGTGFNGSAYIPVFNRGDTALHLFISGNRTNHYEWVFMQMLLACITVSIVAGAVVERMKPWVLTVLAIVISGIIYPTQGFWVWGEGFLNQLGFIDVSGAGVVHLCASMIGFTCLIVLGPRQGRFDKANKIRLLPGGNLPLATLGLVLVWIGSFGFNTGFIVNIMSVPAGTLGAILVNTQMAASGGLLSALILSRIFWGKADLSISLNGAMSGLVAIAASPLAPSVYWALLIGFAAGIFCVLTIVLINRSRLDDPIGIISAHGSAAMWGLIAVVFTHEFPLSVTMHESWLKQLVTQCIGIIVISAWSFISTWLVLWLISKIARLRLNEQEEYRGLDQSIYGMQAYSEHD